MNISNHEYHIRMLGDLAIQRKPSTILDLLTRLVGKVAEKLDIPVEILLLMMQDKLEERKEVDDDESQEAT